MITNFNISDSVITGNVVPIVVADKILEFHLNPIQVVRTEMNIPIWASLKSTYRPYSWEIARGRNGKSQHCFGEDKDGNFDVNEKGASDWTCKEFEKNKVEFLNSLIKNTKYTRMAVYNGFIHCDYKDIGEGKRAVYSSNSKSQWKFIKFV